MKAKFYNSWKTMENKNKLIFEFDEKTHENSEGQHIVFYLENEIIGGGEIKNI